MLLFLVLAGNSALFRFYVVTRSYSSCLFLCALGRNYSLVAEISGYHKPHTYTHTSLGQPLQPAAGRVEGWVLCTGSGRTAQERLPVCTHTGVYIILPIRPSTTLPAYALMELSVAPSTSELRFLALISVISSTG